jgi:hypothetical protein
MMSAFDRSRFDWYPAGFGGAAEVQGASGAPRPRLAVPLRTFTVHYTGAGTQWLDYGDTVPELRSIEQYARGVGKPNEYNSVSDSESVTWEYAGPFRAAHSAGENETAWGHLVLYGLEALTEAGAAALIAGVIKARVQCVKAGYLTPDHKVVPHCNMPGASTTCPGPLWTNTRWWAALSRPLVPADFGVVEPPTVTLPEEDPVAAIKFIALPPDPVVTPNAPWFICTEFDTVYCTGEHYRQARAAGWPEVRLDAERYANLRKSVGI